MGEMSSIGEVLELAISRETQAAEFLMALAGRMGNPAMQVVFERLAQEELEHKARLELEVMKEGIVAKTVGRLIDVGEADYAGELDLGPDVDFKEALGMAIEKERRSFRFYTDLAGIVPEREVHDVLLELAEEEARHLVRFEMEYNKLATQEK
jgi:rubrerythrin